MSNEVDLHVSTSNPHDTPLNLESGNITENQGNNEVDLNVSTFNPYDTPLYLGSGNITDNQGSNKTTAYHSGLAGPQALAPLSNALTLLNDISECGFTDDINQAHASSSTGLADNDYDTSHEVKPWEETDHEQWAQKTQKIMNICILHPTHEILAYLKSPDFSDPRNFLAWNPQVKAYLELPAEVSGPAELLSWTLKPDMSGISDQNIWGLIDYRPPGSEGFDKVRGMDRLRWCFRRMMLFDMHQWFTHCGLEMDIIRAMADVLSSEFCASPKASIFRRCLQGRNLAELCERFGHGCLFYLQEGLGSDS